MCVKRGALKRRREGVEETCEIESNISSISSSLVYCLFGSSQTPLMEFWKRSVILRIFDLIVKIEIGVMFVMVFDS